MEKIIIFNDWKEKYQSYEAYYCDMATYWSCEKEVIDNIKILIDERIQKMQSIDYTDILRPKGWSELTEAFKQSSTS